MRAQVIMATNRADTLDPALLRPGRLDRKIEFPLPDRRQKRLVFQVCVACPCSAAPHALGPARAMLLWGSLCAFGQSSYKLQPTRGSFERQALHCRHYVAGSLFAEYDGLTSVSHSCTLLSLRHNKQIDLMGIKYGCPMILDGRRQKMAATVHWSVIFMLAEWD
jgi:hypothetical protein